MSTDQRDTQGARREPRKYLSLHVNLVNEERAERLERLAERRGCASQGELIRRLIDEAAKRPQKPAARPGHGHHLHQFNAPEDGRLSWEQHQTARELAADANRLAATDLGAAVRKTDELRALIRRDHPDLGERFVLPSGQTAGRFEDAVAAWSA